jgi:hypothetical protein
LTGAAYDEGRPVHYTVVERGTAVIASDGVKVGTVDRVMDNAREHIFDGVVFRAADGALRFVDAPEVRRTAERAVTLTIDSAEAAALPAPSYGVGLLSRLGNAFRGR